MDRKSVLVSVIVPNYNHEKYLVQRLESIFNQTYTNFEVILLDDCSTDNSRVILLEYATNPKVSHCVFNEKNSGNTFVQWNKGIELAKGDFIWIAESDDFCDLNFLEELIKPLLEGTDVVLAYCQSNRVDENGVVTGNWLNHTNDLDSELFTTDFCMDGNEFVEKFLVYKNVIPNASAVVFRKDKIITSTYLNIDSYFKYCGDWIFYLRFITNNKISFIHMSLNNFRYHSTSVIAKAVKIENRISIIEIDYYMRIGMMKFLKENNNQNYAKIIKNNNDIVKGYKYEKAFCLYNNGEKIKGMCLLLTVLNVFFQKYNFKKNFEIKFVRFINKFNI